MTSKGEGYPYGDCREGGKEGEGYGECGDGGVDSGGKVCVCVCV